MYNMYLPWDAALDRAFWDEEYPERLDDVEPEDDDSRRQTFNSNQLAFNFD